jgi:hypothetical protein
VAHPRNKGGNQNVSGMSKFLAINTYNKKIQKDFR